ncbi:MAG: molybdate ABC transporter substrate-binding protein [Spirochaetota bacterium]
MKKKSLKLLLCIFCTVLFVIPAFAGDISISVAASLKDVMAELTQNFTVKNPGIKFQTNLGGSGALAKQIASGAPADIFFSANTEWIDFLKSKKLIEQKNISIMAYNVLVFVGKPGLKANKISDITTFEKIAIGSPKSVPAGEYAMQAIKKAGIEKQLENKLVMAKDVRECLMYAEKGEVSGAFVYKTDAEEKAKNVKILFVVPQDMYSRVTYPMALTAAGTKNPEAVAFYKFLQTDKAKEILLRHGFNIK